jgi:glutaredoxin
MLTIYSKKDCSYCMQAETMCKKYGIPYSMAKIDEDETAYEFLVKSGHRSVPQIYIGKELFCDNGYKGMLELGPADVKAKINEMTGNIDPQNLGSI